MTTQENRLAEIRKAIEAENVSLGELSELQDIAATHPELFADDPALAEAAGIPEEQWRNPAKHTPGPWSIEAVKDYLRMLDTGIDSAAPESIANARLIAAAPDLLEALRGSVEWLRRLREESEAAVIESAPDGFSLCDAEAIIAKAEGRAGE